MTIATKEFNRPVVGTITNNEIVSRVSPVLAGASCDNRAHFERGIDSGIEMEYVTIAVNNVWGGLAKDGGYVSSYEKIGYHTGSDCWLSGVISSGCPVYAYCEDGWRRVVFYR